MRPRECCTCDRVKLETRVTVPEFRDCLGEDPRKDKSAHRTIQSRSVSTDSTIDLSSRREAVESAVCFFERATEHVEIRLGRGGRELTAGIDRTST